MQSTCRPVVSLDSLNVSGLAWTFKLLPSEGDDSVGILQRFQAPSQAVL